MKLLPGWHPMVVHFPLALVVTAALFLLSARLLRRESYVATLATVGTWNLCLGAFAALLALATGLAATVGLHAGVAAHQSLSAHVKWAIFTTLALVLLAATAALIVTGYHGGQNVYRHGIGVITTGL